MDLAFMVWGVVACSETTLLAIPSALLSLSIASVLSFW